MNNIRFPYQKAGPSKLRKPATPIHNSVYNINDKKPPVMKSFFKSIRRLPKVMFGRGASKGEHKGTSGDGEGTSTSTIGITTGNTLPQYVSNPPTPVIAHMPSHYTHQPIRMQMPISIPTVPMSGSSPPEVVRLDDVRRRRPDFRIMPPSVNIARSETAHFFPGTTDSSSSTANTAERTTVMLYNHDHQTPAPTPPLSRQISSNGPPGQLSHVGSEQIFRPTSFHGGSQAPPPIEIPTSIARIGTPASYLSYVSQPTTVPSTLPLHIKRSSSQLRSQLPNQSQSQRIQQHQPTLPPAHQPSSTPPVIKSPELIQSPVSAHPQPTTDYLKMALSPPHSLQHNTTALTNLTSGTPHSSSGVTSFSYDPSFSKTSSSSPIERFFKTLYHMPWIAYERITVDYLPGKVGRVHGHGLSREASGRRVRDERKVRRSGDRRKRGKKDRDRDGVRRRKERRTRANRYDEGRLVSWYKGVSSRSKKTRVELDLLNSDLGSHSSPTTITSLEAAVGLGLENLPDDAASPGLTANANSAAVKVEKSADREGQQQERKEVVGDQQERTSPSRRDQRHRQDPHNRHRERQGQSIGSIAGPDEKDGVNRSHSPLIPAVYPFYYPPYPYPYPYTFTLPPPPGPHTQSQSQQDPLSPPPESPNDQTQSGNQRGPRSSKTHQGQSPLPQPVLYNPRIPHLGYTAAAHAYQPMIAPSPTTMIPPPVYLLHSALHAQLQPQASSSSGPMQNGRGVAAGSGVEVPLGAVESSQ